MYQDLMSEADSGFRALPPWADDIDNELGVSDTDVQESAVAITVSDERDASSDSHSSGSSESNAEAARLEVDAESLAFFKTRPAEAVDRWRHLYTDRSRRGINKDLWKLTRAAAALAEAQIIPDHRDRSMFRRLTKISRGFFTFVEDVVSQSDFFDEYPDFVISMLDVVYSICINSVGFEIVEALSKNAWEQRWLLYDSEVIDRLYPMARWETRRKLRAIMLTVLSPPFSPTLNLRRSSFLCWYCDGDGKADDETDLLLSTVLLHHALLGSPMAGEDMVLPVEDTLEFIRLGVIPTFGAEKYLARLLETLQHHELLDANLNRAIAVLHRSITHPDLFAKLGPSGVLAAALDAVNRQATYGKPGTQSSSLCNLVYLYTFISELGLTADVPGAPLAIPCLFRDGCYVNIVARASRVCAIDNDNVGGLDYDLCCRSLTALRSCARVMDRLSARNSSRKAMRRSVREDWYPTLDFLRRMRARSTSIPDHDRLSNDWKSLGEDLGFEEETQKSEYERQMRKALRHCARKECPYHEKEPTVSLRSCKGCTEVRYCSRSCQRDDWKGGHKRRCKRLNEATPSDAT